MSGLFGRAGGEDRLGGVVLPGLVLAIGLAVASPSLFASLADDAASPEPGQAARGSAGPGATCPAVSSPGLAIDPSPPIGRGAPVAASESPQTELTVFAAASLGRAFEALREPWEAAHPGSALVLSIDASSALRHQLAEGARADVMASAAVSDAEALIAACLAEPPVAVFATNRLAIVLAPGNPADLASPADLARPGVRLVAAGPEVPISRYARVLVDRLAAVDGYPGGFAARIRGNVVSEEDNVRAVLAKVALGEADAGIVYGTDALAAPDLGTLELPGGVDVSTQLAAVALRGPRAGAAGEFIDFLRSPSAEEVLRTLGFGPPP